MKLSIARSELARGLARVQTIVEKRNSMPILANALLEAVKDGAGGWLKISATDLEVGIAGTHAADVASAGTTAVSARKLHEIVRELPDEPVALETAPNSYLELRCGRSRFVLAAAAGEEYPTLPGVVAERTVRIQAAVLSSMIDRTLYAASVDETRYNLNGVYLEVLEAEQKLRMVATDGHRLAYADRSIGDEISQISSGVIIPRKGLGELKRLVDEEDADEVELGFAGNSAIAVTPTVKLVMRLIEGEFPNYRQVLPKTAKHRITLPSDALAHVLRRVSLVAVEGGRGVRLQVTPGKVVISAKNPDLGEAVEELDLDYAGEPVSIGFNARYLIDCLGVFRAKEVEIGLIDELSPVQIRPTDDLDALAVVMPMRL
ncbi:DNA polymerase III subunit beta [Myxococcaceae bacterium]|jgi:DNA polymerase-3 subunit beta|nr:DNA polymerase III subunit beta [Myxococcaceae bacterium]